MIFLIIIIMHTGKHKTTQRSTKTGVCITYLAWRKGVSTSSSRALLYQGGCDMSPNSCRLSNFGRHKASLKTQAVMSLYNYY